MASKTPPLGKKKILQFQEKIFTWWKKNRRDLPWRHTHDPYAIMVSEVMLQQTQVSRVLPAYLRFLHTFPTVQSLSKATPAAVIRQWKGMGYNRRALYLQKAASSIVTQHNGVFPHTEKALLALPGIGKYTARAILVFAFKKDVSLIDTNIRKIITFHFFTGHIQKEKTIEEAADLLLPEGKSWEWHQALMDYGALALSGKRIAYSGKKKPLLPFRESQRFHRGRIIDVLRDATISETDLIRSFRAKYNKSPEYFTGLITSLVKEGLIMRSGSNMLSLSI